MASPHAVEADRLLTKVTHYADSLIEDSERALMDGPRRHIGLALAALVGIGRAILAIGDSE